MNSRVKGENIGNIISLFSAGCFGTIVCRFIQMTDCLGVGRKKEKTALSVFKFRGRLVVESLNVWTLLRLKLQWEIQLKEMGGQKGEIMLILGI